MRDGKVVDATGKRSLTYVDLAKSDEAGRLFARSIPSDIELTPVKEWKVLGTPVLRPNARDIVIGAHQYPSDISGPECFMERSCARRPLARRWLPLT